jgi:hypothetical protein
MRVCKRHLRGPYIKDSWALSGKICMVDLGRDYWARSLNNVQ